jgi:hypothetical protein
MRKIALMLLVMKLNFVAMMVNVSTVVSVVMVIMIVMISAMKKIVT